MDLSCIGMGSQDLLEKTTCKGKRVSFLSFPFFYFGQSHFYFLLSGKQASAVIILGNFHHAFFVFFHTFLAYPSPFSSFISRSLKFPSTPFSFLFSLSFASLPVFFLFYRKSTLIATTFREKYFEPKSEFWFPPCMRAWAPSSIR